MAHIERFGLRRRRCLGGCVMRWRKRGSVFCRVVRFLLRRNRSRLLCIGMRFRIGGGAKNKRRHSADRNRAKDNQAFPV
jgi:hypothetical protein